MVTFIGGPWDLHRVPMVETPPRWYVPVMERRMGARMHILAEEHGEPPENLFKRAKYRLARWVAFSSSPKYDIYVYEGTE
jgi:hypothetical protein